MARIKRRGRIEIVRSRCRAIACPSVKRTLRDRESQGFLHFGGEQ